MAPSPCYRCAAAAILLALALTVRVATEDCNLVGDSDKESKKEKEVLELLAPLRSKKFSYTFAEGTDNYTYVFKVCGSAGNASGSGLVQLDNKNSGKETVIGRIDETHLIRGSDWILLMYRRGDKYDNHCNGEERQAMVMISCDSKTVGSGFMMVNEERAKVQNCFYLFEMDSKVACPPADTRLSVGSILLIVLASLIAVYLIVGFLYQRLVVGAKGMEQIPNYTFWQDLGNLMADGCDFVCRSKPRNVPTAYRGVGDDQLGEEPEERDDHLLPM